MGTALRICLLALAAVTVVTGAAAGGPGAVLSIAISAAIVLVLATFLSDPLHRSEVVTVAVGILLARIVVTAVMHLGLQRQNEGGAMFEDDFGYVVIGNILARIWSGEPLGPQDMPAQFDSSTVHSYSRAVGAIFLIFGPNVAVAKLANSALAVIAALMIYRATLLVAGRQAAILALIALALWPSLALWTSLTLKEGVALACAAGTVWAVVELVRAPRLRWFAGVLAFTLPLQDARPYLHAVLLGLWPITLLTTRAFTGRPRLIWGVAAGLAAIIAISGVRPGLALSWGLVGSAEEVRTGMAEGARSAIVEATRQFVAPPGTCMVVRVPGTGSSTGSPQVHMVPPNTPLVFAGRTTTDIQPPQSSVRVRDGDLVCVQDDSGGPRSAPVGQGEPEMTPSPNVAEVFVTTTGSTRVTEASGGESMTPTDSDIVRNLAYLPRGAMLLMVAPLPWDILPFPPRWPLLIEMVLWYGLVVLAILGLAAVVRERRWEALYPVLVGLAVAGVLSLAEGNLGTLVRHRGMVIPYAIIIASLVMARWPALRYGR